MTYKEKYGTFETFQRIMAEKSINMAETILQTPRSFYSVVCNMSDSDITNRYKSALNSIEYFRQVLKNEIEDSIYRAYWEQMIKREAKTK